MKEKYGYGFEEGKFADTRHAADEKLGIKRNRINLKEAIESDKEQIRQKDEITPDIVKKKTHHVHH